MKRLLLAAVFAALSASAFAQTFPTAPAGQTPGGIQADTFTQNSQPIGFAETAFTTVAGAGTTQATSTLITARTVVITACPASAGVVLPSLIRYSAITLVNRSGGSCLVYPSPGAALETAAGTTAAANAPFTMLTNTDVIFRPILAAGSVVWYQ